MKNGSSVSPWILRPVSRPAAHVRLFCFPYAGAGAAVFRNWASELPAQVEACAVRLPGRETRLGEPPFVDMRRLVAATLEGLSPFMDRPFAFFGHSMGAVLAFELTRTLRRTPGAPLPSHVIVSGRQGPRAPSRFPPIAHLPDDEFLKALDERYGGIPAEVAREPELLRLLLPCIKADILSVEKHDWVEEEPLERPITALCGTDDPTTFPEEAELWGRETTGSFALGLVPGGHFFLNTARAQVVQIVARALFAKPRSPLSVPHD